MANVLVDTSAWVEYFRKGEGPAAVHLDHLLEERQAALCGVVEMELLQGARSEEKNMLQDLLAALPYVEADRADYQTAGELLAGLRAKGLRVPATDALIAALCLRRSINLLTLDKHFDLIHQVKKIKI
jgi:predicted nucleic acid-binding protein